MLETNSEGLSEYNIGVIGTGRMGSGIASCLLKAGASVAIPGYRSHARAAWLQGLGAILCDTQADVAAHSKFLILCLPTAEDVERVVQPALLGQLSPGSMIVDCTTSLPEISIALAAEAQAFGVTFIDAPLTRTPQEALQGRLNAIVGGAPEHVLEVLPILKSFCEHVFHVGAVGDGIRIKLLNNCLSLGMAALAGEVLKAARTLGIDIARFRDVVSVGGGNSSPFQGMARWLLDPTEDVLAFSLSNAAKDIGYARRLIHSLPLDLRVLEGVYAAYVHAVTVGGAAGQTLPHYMDLIVKAESP